MRVQDLFSLRGQAALVTGGGEREGGSEAEVERKATRLVAYTFFILGAYVAFDACRALYTQEEPEPTILGLVVAVASIIVMPMLFYLKYRLGVSMGSQTAKRAPSPAYSRRVSSVFHNAHWQPASSTLQAMNTPSGCADVEPSTKG